MTTTLTTTEFATAASAWQVRLTRYSGSTSVVVEVERSFAANDTAAYMAAEREANDLLALAPVTASGTVWGTDSASVGGHAGLTGGYMRLCKSGVSIRWANTVAKQLGITVGIR